MSSHSTTSQLLQKCSINPTIAYAVAIVLALCHVAYMYSPQFLLGHTQFFADGDAAQHVSGWLFFRADSWHFPLLRTERLNFPDGANIAFTDSIPLLALPMKLLSPLLPDNFQYIGLWHAIAYLCGACGAVFLMRSLGVHGLFGAIVAVFFTLGWPAMLWRLGHTSLTTHGLLLFSLGLYFRGINNSCAPATIARGFVVLTALALLIHPYLLAMCYTIFLAYLADRVLTGSPLREQLKIFAASIAVIGALVALLGYGGNGTQAGGFDVYSMNLTAPLCGAGRLWDCAIDGTGGQGEGFNYLGAGVLLIVLPAFAIFGHESLRRIRLHKALFVVCLLLVAYALSTKIYASKHLLFEYALPLRTRRLTMTFRVSGRFFWSVGYLSLFVMLASLLRQKNKMIHALVAIALLLQLYDVQPLREIVRANANRPLTTDLSAWQAVLDHNEHINIYPTWTCGSSDMDFQLYMQSVAAKFGKTLNSGYIARASANCDKKHRIFYRDFEAGSVYVTRSNNPQNKLPEGFTSAIAANRCRNIGDKLVCHGT